MEHDLHERGGVVGGGLPGSFCLLESAHKAGVRLKLYLPRETGHKLLVGVAAASVGQDALLVLLSLPNEDDGDLVRLPTSLRVKILQLSQYALILLNQLDVRSLFPRGQTQLVKEPPALLEGISGVGVTLFFWR